VRLLLALIALFVSGNAGAQAISCRIPDRLPAARPEPVEASRVVPIGGYSLALSWSPEYCRLRRNDADDRLQCAGPSDRFGFVVHGLWPDGQGDLWPQYCRPGGLVPNEVSRATICTMPSVQLQQHEWSKHGVCAFPSAEAYFRASRALYGAIRFPDMDALSRNKSLHAAGLAAAFAARNPRIKPAMLRMDINPRGWLEGIVVCLDQGFRPRACPTGGAERDRRPVRIWRAAR
jgi:ribonuclease T2